MSVARDVEDAHDDHDRAISDASKAIRANPRNADAYCARAANHLAKKQTK
jgi:hypothetical protein